MFPLNLSDGKQPGWRTPIELLNADHDGENAPLPQYTICTYMLFDVEFPKRVELKVLTVNHGVLRYFSCLDSIAKSNLFHIPFLTSCLL